MCANTDFGGWTELLVHSIGSVRVENSLIYIQNVLDRVLWPEGLSSCFYVGGKLQCFGTRCLEVRLEPLLQHMSKTL